LLGRLALDASAMTVVLWMLVGLAGGIAHFVLLRSNARLYLAGGGVPLALGMQVLRLAATALVLGFAAWHGALPLLLTALGFTFARVLVLRATREAR
jgi:hypothetical protein